SKRRGSNCPSIGGFMQLCEAISARGYLSQSAAIPFAFDRTAAGAASAEVLAFGKSGVRAMLFSRIQLVTAGLLSLMLVGSGTGWLLNAGKARVTANDGPAVSEKTDQVRTDQGVHSFTVILGTSGPQTITIT